MDGISLGVVAAGLAGIGMILLGGVRRGRRIGQQNPLREIQREVRHRSVSQAQDIIRDLEVRVYDYGRSMEARIESHLSLLDRLIVDADREISRLEGILAESRQGMPIDRALSRSEQQRCFALKEAGFSVEEAARCLNTTPAQVQAALDEWQSPRRHAA